MSRIKSFNEFSQLNESKTNERMTVPTEVKVTISKDLDMEDVVSKITDAISTDSTLVDWDYEGYKGKTIMMTLDASSSLSSSSKALNKALKGLGIDAKIEEND